MKAKLAQESRTVLFGLTVVALATLELLQGHLPVLLADVAPKTNAWITLGIGIGIIVLRFVTSSPVSLTRDDESL